MRCEKDVLLLLEIEKSSRVFTTVSHRVTTLLVEAVHGKRSCWLHRYHERLLSISEISQVRCDAESYGANHRVQRFKYDYVIPTQDFRDISLGFSVQPRTALSMDCYI